MTKKELGKLYALQNDIKRLTDRIEELSTPSVVSSLTGTPSGSMVGDPTGRMAVQISALRLKLEAARLDAVVELQRITEYIEEIADPVMRQIMHYRHVDGLTWAAVARRVGGRNSAESVRKAHDRFLNEE